MNITILKKTVTCIQLTALLAFAQVSFSQLDQNLLGNANIGTNPQAIPFDQDNTGGRIIVSSTGGTVGGGSIYFGGVHNESDINNASNAITATHTNVTTATKFKAIAGVPITIDIQINTFQAPTQPCSDPCYNSVINTIAENLDIAIGDNKQSNLYSLNTQISPTQAQYVSGLKAVNYSYTLTFEYERTEAWIVIKIPISNNKTGAKYNNLVVLPFVVEPRVLDVKLLGNLDLGTDPTIIPCNEDNTGGRIKITSSGTNVGGGQTYGIGVFNGHVEPGTLTLSEYRNSAKQIVPTENKILAIAGQPLVIEIEISYFSAGFFTDAFCNGYNLANGSGKLTGFNGDSEEPVQSPFNINSSPTDENGIRTYKFTREFTFQKGDGSAHIILNVTTNSDGSIFDENFITHSNYVVLPVIVTGPTLPAGTNIPVIGSTSEPAIPYMILHNPPGDGSFTSMTTTEEVCRSLETTATDETNKAFGLDVTIGFSADLGVFVTIPIEVGITMSFDREAGNSTASRKGSENCIKIENEIKTETAGSGANNGSIYMCYATDYDLGVYPLIKITDTYPLEAVQDTGLIFAPTGYNPQYLTKSDILSEIITNQSIIDNEALTSAVRSQANNQNKIWKQVIEKDSLNIINPNNEVLEAEVNVFAGVSVMKTSTVSYSSTTSYEVSHYLSESFGLNHFASIAGSGFDLGFAMTTTKTFGMTSATNTTTEKSISYSIADDDMGDKFNVTVVRDPTYGTPIFLVDESKTRSSCPYEGGYRRDQPRLSGDTQCIFQANLQNLYVDNIDENASAVIKLNICNDSDEERNYLLELTNNNNGANVSVGNTALNNVNSIIEFTIAAGACQVPLLTIGRNPALPKAGANGYLPSYDVYNDLTFLLYPACGVSPEESEGIKSTVSVTFGRTGMYPLGDSDCDGTINAQECGLLDTLNIDLSFGALTGDYYAKKQINVMSDSNIPTGISINMHAPIVEVSDFEFPSTSEFNVISEACNE